MHNMTVPCSAAGHSAKGSADSTTASVQSEHRNMITYTQSAMAGTSDVGFKFFSQSAVMSPTSHRAFTSHCTSESTSQSSSKLFAYNNTVTSCVSRTSTTEKYYSQGQGSPLGSPRSPRSFTHRPRSPGKYLTGPDCLKDKYVDSNAAKDLTNIRNNITSSDTCKNISKVTGYTENCTIQNAGTASGNDPHSSGSCKSQSSGKYVPAPKSLKSYPKETHNNIFGKSFTFKNFTDNIMNDTTTSGTAQSLVPGPGSLRQYSSDKPKVCYKSKPDYLQKYALSEAKGPHVCSSDGTNLHSLQSNANKSSDIPVQTNSSSDDQDTILPGSPGTEESILPGSPGTEESSPGKYRPNSCPKTNIKDIINMFNPQGTSCEKTEQSPPNRVCERDKEISGASEINNENINTGCEGTEERYKNILKKFGRNFPEDNFQKQNGSEREVKGPTWSRPGLNQGAPEDKDYEQDIRNSKSSLENTSVPEMNEETVQNSDNGSKEDNSKGRFQNLLRKSSQNRCKSDSSKQQPLKGTCHGLSEVLQNLLRRDRFNSAASLLTPEGSLSDSRHNLRSRRMSTPQPIRSRQARSVGSHKTPLPLLLRRKSRSAPDLTEDNMYRSKRQRDVFRMSTSTAGDLALQPHDYSSDDDSEDSVSYGAVSMSSSILSLRQQATLEEIFEDHESPTYAEALWDHVTMDTEEIGFRAGDVIEVLDLGDRDWWYGQMSDQKGWFPAAFVRLRANQAQIITEDEDIPLAPQGGSTTHIHKPLKATDSVSQTQARTNVVREILHAEREYVRHLRDVVQGYVEKCRKRPEMFTPEKLASIFGNISTIYGFSTTFLRDLETNTNHEQPHTSCLGRIFLKNSEGFEIYSEYCNNHPTACEELRTLQKNKRYTHFFEACRLLQDMIELPLEGFLLTPVQKICKYPLQLRELLKYTPKTHPDYSQLATALETMHRIAIMINERKRKMESMEKLAEWQRRIEDWQGQDLLDQSSELIYSGEMTKVNNSGWHQDRMFFLFDHQLVYCKKDMLWRDLLMYKGRIDLDNCLIKALPDDKDPIFNIHVKNAFRVYDNGKGKWYLMYCRSHTERARWFRAFQQERQRVEEDKKNSFKLQDFRQKIHQPHAKVKAHPSARYRERSQKQKKHHGGHHSKHSDKTKILPPSQGDTVSQPHTHDIDVVGDTGHGKRWFNFGHKKNKRPL